MTPENCHSLVQNRYDHLIQLLPSDDPVLFKNPYIYTKRLKLPTVQKSISVMIWWHKFIVVMNTIWRWQKWMALEGMLKSLVLQCLYHAVNVNHRLCTFMLKSSPYFYRYWTASMSNLWAKCDLPGLHLSPWEFLNTFDLCSSSFHMMEHCF